MRRGQPQKIRRGILQARFIIPVAFLLVGVIVAYGFMSENSDPEPRVEPIIIRPDNIPPIADDIVSQVSANASEDVGSLIIAGPIDSSGLQEDQFSDVKTRVSAFKIGSAELKKTVALYSDAKSNQCAGEITVRTDDTPLNVRSRPSTGSPVLTKVPKGSKHSVLLWAPDEKTKSGRWFLLVDEKKKTVKGWVSGEYCETSGVVFAN
jgi:hypothetical protein